MGANLSSSYENSNVGSQDEMSNLNASSLQARIEEIHRRTRLRRAPPPPPIRRSSLLTSNVENDDSKSEGNEQSTSSIGKFLQFFPPFIIFFLSFTEQFGILTTIQSDLRKKYLNEIESIQRRVSSDAESWASLDQTVEEIQGNSQFYRMFF